MKTRQKILFLLISLALGTACRIFSVDRTKENQVSTAGLKSATATMGANAGKIPTRAMTATAGSIETALPTAKPGEIRQWASFARASSQFDNPNWSASQAVGEPDVFECGDNIRAWASLDDDTIEWIELTYRTAVTPTQINIYQNLNPSQVVEVQMTALDGTKYNAWEGYPEKVETCPDLMTIELELTKKILVNKVRITIDQRVSGWGWNEIDAVELVGTPK
ncbi:MAG: hypothetical protein GYA15_08715 [Leptolinea sp.]|jgi:hypothetical protein|nr:hypothetical protein [Leptolinea sp.]